MEKFDYQHGTEFYMKHYMRLFIYASYLVSILPSASPDVENISCHTVLVQENSTGTSIVDTIYMIRWDTAQVYAGKTILLLYILYTCGGVIPI